MEAIWTATEDHAEQPTTPLSTAQDAIVPTGQLLAAPVADRCASCGGPLTSDQRYCLSCGERRGRARFPVERMLATPSPAPPPPRRPTPRPSANATLVAGVATLLLAMGIGVLIGHLAGQGSSPARAAGTAPITVIAPGGGPAVAAASTTPASSSASSTGNHHARGAKTSVKTVVINKQVAQKATQAASKVLGGGSNLASPTVTQGSSCSGGAGCQGGKFTGGFFGQ